MCEILAPAGGKESAISAINSGADAIYLGLTAFSARSSAENFDKEGLAYIIRYAHAFGVKVYVAMNTLIKDCELESFIKTLLEVWNDGADAVIIADLFLGRYIKRFYPDIKLHLSTQAGICNVYGAKLAKEYGFDRVILARETPFEEICKITPVIETETFIQGALCTCFSGQCYFSSFVGGNSGNRGRCKQPCRKLYSIDKKGFETPAYRLSLADLSVGENIKKLIEAGVASFKIEGRMRRPEYVAAAVNYYRAILDGKNVSAEFVDLKRTYNRGNYTVGLAFGQDKSFISAAVQGHIGDYVGVVKVQNGKFICLSQTLFKKGDSFKILRGGKEVCGADYGGATAGGFVLNTKVRLLNGDKVFVTTDTAVNQRLLNVTKKINLNISARFFADEKPVVTVNGTDFCGDFVLQSAISNPIDFSEFKDCFSKVDRYPFNVAFDSFETDGVFVPLSKLNSLRRSVFENLFNFLGRSENEQVAPVHVLPQLNSGKNNKTAVICRKNAPDSADIIILKPDDYDNAERPDKPRSEIYLYLPPFATSAETEIFKKAAGRFDGIYCDGTWAIVFCRDIGKPLFAGCGFNISNRIGVSECAAKYVALSKELTAAEQSDLCGENTFALSCGDIKLMDLIYCPFGKKCADCDKRIFYTLTDEGGRKFSIRRYAASQCRFEIYNCARLAGISPTGTLIDCSTIDRPQNIISLSRDEKAQKDYFKNYTHGHTVSPIF